MAEVIISVEDVLEPNIARYQFILPGAIVSVEDIGTHLLTMNVLPSAIVSVEDVPVSVFIGLLIEPTGIVSVEYVKCPAIGNWLGITEPGTTTWSAVAEPSATSYSSVTGPSSTPWSGVSGPSSTTWSDLDEPDTTDWEDVCE